MRRNPSETTPHMEAKAQQFTEMSHDPGQSVASAHKQLKLKIKNQERYRNLAYSDPFRILFRFSQNSILLPTS